MATSNTNTSTSNSTASNSTASYSVQIQSVDGDFLFQSDVFNNRSDAQSLINYMSSDECDSVTYIVYKNKPLHSTRMELNTSTGEEENNVNEHYHHENLDTSEPLSDMYIEPYGRGYILVPHKDDYRHGRKYFYDAWWMPKADAWFFKAEYLDKFIDLGAAYDGSAFDTTIVEDDDSTYDLSEMSLIKHGRGFLLIPPRDSEWVGEKYFMDGWWMPSKNGWFFKAEYFDSLLEAGVVYENITTRSSSRKNQHSASTSTTDYSLSGMKISSYGKGYLLTPPANHEMFGEKYFLNGWWRADLNGWFFRARYYEDLIGRGAKEGKGRGKSAKRS